MLAQLLNQLEAAFIQAWLPTKFATLPERLEAAGYHDAEPHTSKASKKRSEDQMRWPRPLLGVLLFAPLAVLRAADAPHPASKVTQQLLNLLFTGGLSATPVREHMDQEHILGNSGSVGKKVFRARPNQSDAREAAATSLPVVESRGLSACRMVGNVTIQLRWPRRTGTFVRGVNGHAGGPRRQVLSQGQVNR
jgi:hypothetical protein